MDDAGVRGWVWSTRGGTELEMVLELEVVWELKLPWDQDGSTRLRLG